MSFCNLGIGIDTGRQQLLEEQLANAQRQINERAKSNDEIYLQIRQGLESMAVIQMEIDLLPTWFRWEPADRARLLDGRALPAADGAGGSTLDARESASADDDAGAPSRDLGGVRGVLADGRPVRIQGTWRETGRIEGALPKLDVQARLMERRQR